MRRIILGGWGPLACLVALAFVAHAHACKGCMEMVLTIPDRFARAETVVIGKVKSIEAKPVSAIPAVGVQQKQDYQIAVIEVSEVLAGARVAQVRVGFVAPPTVPQAKPAADTPLTKECKAAPLPVLLSVGQEGCFFLVPHCEQSFSLILGHSTTIDKKVPTSEKDIALAKRCGKLAADPMAGMRSKDAEDRLIAASIQLTRCRTYKGPANVAAKLQPIDAEQSKLILQAVATADWTAANPQQPPVVQPQNLFWQLGITAQDGWAPPAQGFKDQKEFETAAKKWLTENADKYRIQGYLEEKTISTKR